MANIKTARKDAGAVAPSDEFGFVIPASGWPDDMLGYWRLGGSIAASKVNQIGGAGAMPNGTVFPVGTDPTVSGQGLQTIQGGVLYAPAPLNAPCTMYAVIDQPASAPAVGITYAGYIYSNQFSLGITLGNTGNLAAFLNGTNAAGGNVAATIPMDGGARAEFLAAIFDWDEASQEGVVTLFRPRTETIRSLPFFNNPVISSNYRILGSISGNNGAAKGYANSAASRAHELIEARAVYKKIQALLAAEATPTSI